MATFNRAVLPVMWRQDGVQLLHLATGGLTGKAFILLYYLFIIIGPQRYKIKGNDRNDLIRLSSPVFSLGSQFCFLCCFDASFFVYVLHKHTN